MSDVSVIGTGVMGAALVEVLAASGAAVSDHQVTRTLVAAAGADVTGRVVASTSFVTPERAQALDSVVSTAGGAYLDLEIVASPGQVRSGTGACLVSGERTAYEAHRGMLERIGHVTYVDDSPGSAYTSGMAVTVAYLPMAVGILQGMHIARSLELSPDWFRDAVVDLYPFQIEQLLGRLTASTAPSAEVEASVDTMAAWAAEYGEALRGMGLDAGMFDALHRLFTAASAAGHGNTDWTCIAEHVVTR